MSARPYLKDRLSLYVAFSAVTAIVCLVILLMPYDTVYVRDRAYLSFFLVVMVISIAVFLFGVLYNALIWMHGRGLTGSPEGRLIGVTKKCLRFTLSRRFSRLMIVLLRDALFLSRLRTRSTLRWLMHLLILGGFILMFLLDIIVTVSLDAFKYGPMMVEDGWAKLWIRDFAFDLAGALVLAGLVIAAARRLVSRSKIVRTELPDATSIVFLLLVVVGGFVLEGMGIAGGIPGHGSNAEYSFLGYAFALAIPDSLGQYYDQAWLMHGILSALLIAYIPFSKLFHMFATPIAIELDSFHHGEASA